MASPKDDSFLLIPTQTRSLTQNRSTKWKEKHTVQRMHEEAGNVRKDKEQYTSVVGRAIAQAVSRSLSTAAAWDSSPGLVMWDLWWTKWRQGRFSPSTSVSPANLHSTNCSTIILIYHLGLVQ
jgi:hypothetical protein